MVKLSVNLDEIETTDFKIIEAGKYEAEISDLEEKDSSSGHPMLVWTWKITKGDEAGTTLKSYTTLQEHALFGLKQHLAALGIDGDLQGFETDSLIGKMAMLSVTKPKIVSRDTGEDIDVNRVDKVLPLKGAAKSPKKGKGKGKGKGSATIPL